jgi:GTP-binding protein
MKINEVHFLTSCGGRSAFPESRHPEIAFFGRSNVGKSSLINMLVNRKKLVKTGSRPGVTKTVNFFILNNYVSIADLPGYGYAAAPVQIKKTLLPLIRRYILSRKNLRLAFLLIDIRRIPDHFEREILSLLSGNKIPVAITLTKCDKVSRNRQKQNSEAIGDTLGIDSENLFITSAKTKAGRKELLGLIRELSDQKGPGG